MSGDLTLVHIRIPTGGSGNCVTLRRNPCKSRTKWDYSKSLSARNRNPLTETPSGSVSTHLFERLGGEQIELLGPRRGPAGDRDHAVALGDRGGLRGDLLADRVGPDGLDGGERRRRRDRLDGGADRLGDGAGARREPIIRTFAFRFAPCSGRLGRGTAPPAERRAAPPLTAIDAMSTPGACGTWALSVAVSSACPAPASDPTSSSRRSGSSSLITSSSSMIGALRPASISAARSANSSARSAARCWPCEPKRRSALPPSRISTSSSWGP